MSPLSPCLKKNAQGFLLQIKVQPGASSSRIEEVEGDFLKIRLQAPPQEGKANQALMVLLKKTLGISKRSIRIIQGEKSRYKTLQLEIESTESHLRGLLGINT